MSEDAGWSATETEGGSTSGPSPAPCTTAREAPGRVIDDYGAGSKIDSHQFRLSQGTAPTGHVLLEERSAPDDRAAFRRSRRFGIDAALRERSTPSDIAVHRGGDDELHAYRCAFSIEQSNLADLFVERLVAFDELLLQVHRRRHWYPAIRGSAGSSTLSCGCGTKPFALSPVPWANRPMVIMTVVPSTAGASGHRTRIRLAVRARSNPRAPACSPHDARRTRACHLGRRSNRVRLAGSKRWCGEIEAVPQYSARHDLIENQP